MAKEEFETIQLSRPRKNQIKVVNGIVDEFMEQGYTLTLRQLYYQLVSRDVVPNVPNEYSKLSKLLVQGRMTGLVDWDAIEDRVRVPYLPYSVESVEEALSDAIKRYRLDRQEGQNVYLELWVEKDALSSILKRMTAYYHIHLMVNRGYSSCTAMHDAYKRFSEQEEQLGKDTCILYLGDHDPSGLDMIRDVKHRLETFGVQPEIRHIGLTMEQIKRLNPPPNPTKVTDPRAKDYIAKFGRTSWELDALSPENLHKVVRENIEDLIDMELFKSVLETEKRDKLKMREFAMDCDTL